MAGASACLAACEAVLPLAQTALSAAGLPAELSGRLLLRLGDKAGVLLTCGDGHGEAQLWQASGSDSEGVQQPADVTVRFDGVESFRRALTDERAVPSLLVRRKVRIEGDLAMLQKFRPDSNGGMSMMPTGADAVAFRQFAKELDAVIAEAVEKAEGTYETASNASSRGPTSFATGWVPNEASGTCMSCQKTFTAFRRRHHCRGCGRLLCNSCAPKRNVPHDPYSTSGCPIAFGRREAGQSKRLCAACVTSGVSASCSFLSDASTSGGRATNSFITSAASVSSLAADSTSPCGNSVPAEVFDAAPRAASGPAELRKLQELKDQVANLQQAESRRAEQRIRHEVRQIWFATQVCCLITTLLLMFWKVKLATAWVALLMFLYFLPGGSHLSRNVRIFWGAIVFTIKWKTTKWRVQSLGLTKEESAAEWSALHDVLGRFLFEQFVELKGFWIKLGQQMSVNVVFAEQYRRELAKLQDKIPSMPVELVLKTIKEELGKEKAACITIDPDVPPLGTASIAQVHRATWRPAKDGPSRDIVVKVQHRGVDSRFRQDLRASSLLARILAWADPEGVPDMRPVIDSLHEVTLNELDFRLEAKNQIRAAKAVSESQADVLVPSVIPDLVARRAMAMDFVDGEPLSKAAERLSQADRDRLVAALVDHFGVQFAVDGHFHADPHPGNLLVEKKSGKLVVLDWGMCVTLPPRTTRAYAILFFAAATSDVWLLIHGLEMVGLNFKDGEVFEPLLFLSIFRFVLRDSKPIALAETEIKDFLKVNDEVYWKGPKRYQKSPVDVFTGDMLYFGKALELLFNVSSQLGARHPILQTLFLRSYTALIGNSQRLSLAIPKTPREMLPTLPDTQLGAASGTLQQNLLSLLCEAYKQGQIMGAQLCVMELPKSSSGRHSRPKLLADLAVGVKSWLNPEPVATSTLFNLLDIAKLPIGMAILRLVETGRLSLSSSVSGLHGKTDCKEQTTVEQVLSHTAGRWHPLPQSVLQLDHLLDFEAMMSSVLSSPTLEAPGHAQRYHYTSFGYLCAAACRNAAGCELDDAWQEIASAAATAASQVQGSSGPSQPSPLLLRLPPDEMTSAAHVQGEASSAGMEEVADLMGRFQAMLDQMSKSDSSEEKSAQGIARDIVGRDHLLHSSLFAGAAGEKTESVCAAMLPGMQAFASAHAVAGLLAAAATPREHGGLFSSSLAQEMIRSRKPSASDDSVADAGIEELAMELGYVLQLDEFKNFGLGVQLVDPESWGGAPAAQPAWGHLSQTGSVALVLPGERPLAVTLLLNMSGRAGAGQQVAWKVLRALQSTAGDPSVAA